MFEFLSDQPALLVIAIVLARVIDVSCATVRTILVVRGYRFIAAGIGFFEVTVWLMASAQVIQNLDRWYLAVAYAGGFALGNIVGVWIEGKIAIGEELVRAVSENRDIQLGDHLRNLGWHVTEVSARNGGGRPVEILLITAPRRRVDRLVSEILSADPDAYCTFSDIRHRAPRRALRRLSVTTLLKRK